jgi:DNA-binding winged helix-turn-helix (wHTH) protein/TolB-like protein/Flp pilus assembly protein TadD
MSEQNGIIYEFGEFKLDVSERLLLRNDEIAALTPKVFDLLVLLVENHGRLMTKEELIGRLWQDSFVEEANLNVNISALRRALGEKPNEHRFIETVPRRGYRFVAEVEELGSGISNDTTEQSYPAETSITQQPTRSFEIAAKKCPKCGKLYYDRTLNYCLDDGEQLKGLGSFKASHMLKIVTAAVAVFLILLTGSWLFGIYPFARATSQIKALAVLPFRPISSDQEDAALELGMADALITKLSRVQAITVRPTGTITKFASADADPIAAGRELGVDAVLEGKVQRAENKIRITVQLLHVPDGQIIWAGSFDDFFTNIFAVQDSISERMVNVLAVKLTPNERQSLEKRYTEDTEAYQLYLQGKYYNELISEEGSKTAIKYYEQAVAKDPDYALAWASMIGPYAHMVNLNHEPELNLQKARNAANKAVTLDPNLPEAHAALAVVYDYFDWNWDAAEKEYLKAIELGPNREEPHYAYSLFLSRFRRHDEAVKEIRIAAQIAPTAQYIEDRVGRALYLARRYDEALAEAQRSLEMKPDGMIANGLLYHIYLATSKFAEAEKMMNRLIEQGTSQPELTRGRFYAAAGEKGEAEKVLRPFIARYKDGDTCWPIAQGYMFLGDIDHTFEFLERSYRKHEQVMTVINVDPVWDPIRGDPRYTDLTQRLHVAP